MCEKAVILHQTMAISQKPQFSGKGTW